MQILSTKNIIEAYAKVFLKQEPEVDQCGILGNFYINDEFELNKIDDHWCFYRVDKRTDFEGGDDSEWIILSADVDIFEALKNGLVTHLIGQVEEEKDLISDANWKARAELDTPK